MIQTFENFNSGFEIEFSAAYFQNKTPKFILNNGSFILVISFFQLDNCLRAYICITCEMRIQSRRCQCAYEYVFIKYKCINE